MLHTTKLHPARPANAPPGPVCHAMGHRPSTGSALFLSLSPLRILLINEKLCFTGPPASILQQNTSHMIRPSGLGSFISYLTGLSLLVRVGSNITSTRSMTPSAVAGLFRVNNDKGCLYILPHSTDREGRVEGILAEEAGRLPWGEISCWGQAVALVCCPLKFVKASLRSNKYFRPWVDLWWFCKLQSHLTSLDLSWIYTVQRLRMGRWARCR